MCDTVAAPTPVTQFAKMLKLGFSCLNFHGGVTSVRLEKQK